MTTNLTRMMTMNNVRREFFSPIQVVVPPFGRRAGAIQETFLVRAAVSPIGSPQRTGAQAISAMRAPTEPRVTVDDECRLLAGNRAQRRTR